jgi:hypothetical protein
MIEDLIELAFAQDIVRAVAPDADGGEEYLLARAGAASPADPPITVWVRPDGRFSRAASTEGLLSLGQVMALCGLARRGSRPQPTRAAGARAPDRTRGGSA